MPPRATGSPDRDNGRAQGHRYREHVLLSVLAERRLAAGQTAELGALPQSHGIRGGALALSCEHASRRSGTIVVRQADPSRWDLARVAATSTEVAELAVLASTAGVSTLDDEELG